VSLWRFAISFLPLLPSPLYGPICFLGGWFVCKVGDSLSLWTACLLRATYCHHFHVERTSRSGGRSKSLHTLFAVFIALFKLLFPLVLLRSCPYRRTVTCFVWQHPCASRPLVLLLHHTSCRRWYLWSPTRCHDRGTPSLSVKGYNCHTVILVQAYEENDSPDKVLLTLRLKLI